MGSNKKLVRAPPTEHYWEIRPRERVLLGGLTLRVDDDAHHVSAQCQHVLRQSGHRGLGLRGVAGGEQVLEFPIVDLREDVVKKTKSIQ